MCFKLPEFKEQTSPLTSQSSCFCRGHSRPHPNVKMSLRKRRGTECNYKCTQQDVSLLLVQINATATTSAFACKNTQCQRLLHPWRSSRFFESHNLEIRKFHHSVHLKIGLLYQMNVILRQETGLRVRGFDLPLKIMSFLPRTTTLLPLF